MNTPLSRYRDSMEYSSGRLEVMTILPADEAISLAKVFIGLDLDFVTHSEKPPEWQASAINTTRGVATSLRTAKLDIFNEVASKDSGAASYVRKKVMVHRDALTNDG